MTTRELAAACKVSEATVVRFVSQIGCSGYGEFIQALREQVDTELNLLDRADLTDISDTQGNSFRRMVSQEIDNLKLLYEGIDLDIVGRIVTLLNETPNVCRWIPAFVCNGLLYGMVPE